MRSRSWWLILALPMLTAWPLLFAPGSARAAAAARPAPTAEQLQDWQEEIDAVADAMIDGEPAEAKELAGRLLQEKRLPARMSSRLRGLRAKAEARLAASPSPEAPPETEKAAGKPPAAVTFLVRQAQAGVGFNTGVKGRLAISGAGIVFTPQGAGREKWAVSWKDFAEARPEEGLWDAPFPFVIVERGGARHYLARLGEGGQYLAAAPVLSSILEERRRQAAPRARDTMPAQPEEGG